MSKMKIEIRKPQYLAVKEVGADDKEEIGGKKPPFFYRLLLVSSYILSVLAIWYVYQKYSMQS